MGKVLEMLPRLKRENTFHLRLDLTLDYIVLAAAHMSRFTLPLKKKLLKFLWKSWWDEDGEQKRRSESVIIGHRFRRTWASIFTWPCRGNKSTHTWVSFILKTQWELMIFFYIAWLMLLFWDCLKISIDRFSGWAGQTVSEYPDWGIDSFRFFWTNIHPWMKEEEKERQRKRKWWKVGSRWEIYKILGESGEKVWIMRKLRRGVGGWGLTNSTKKKRDGELSRWVLEMVW